MIQREWQRIDPKFLDEDEQRYWATIAGRQIRFDQRAEFAKKFAEGRASKPALETFLSVCSAENPNRRLRMTALQDRVSMTVERADFDDLVTLVSQAPPVGEGPRRPGVRILLRAIGEGKANAPDQILQRWTWKLAKTTRKVQDRRASAEFPEAKRLLGAVANSRGHRHEENVQKLIQVAKALPLDVGAALLASSEGYTPRANNALDRAREEIGEIKEIANALADNLPAPKAPSRKSRRRKRKKKPAARARQQPRGRGLGRVERRRARRGRRRAAEAEAAPPAAQAVRRLGRRAARPPPNRPPPSNEERTMLLLLAIGFVAGVVTALSPCVLPVLPIVLAGGATGRRPLAIVAGIVVSFTVFTLFAAWLLDLLGLPEDVLRNLAIALLFLVALTLLVPQVGEWLARPLQFLTRRRGGDLGGGFLLGASLGLVFVPCAGPVLAAVTVIAARRDVGLDSLLLTLSYAIGAAVPMLAIAFARPAGRARLPRPRRARPPRLGRAGRRSGARDHVRRRPEPADRPARLHGGAPEALRALRRGAARAAGADRRPRPRGDRRTARRELEDYGPAPDFHGIVRWLNSKPLTLARAARPRRPGRLLDVLVHQLPADAAARPRLGRRATATPG